MGVFTILLIIFTAATTIFTATLYGVLIGANLFKVHYETAGRWSFIVSFIGVVGILIASGESYATVCTWMSGLSMLGVLGFLITLLMRSVEWK